MKKIIIFLLVLLCTTSLFAQTPNDNVNGNDLTVIQKNIDKQNKEIEILKAKTLTQSSQIQSLLHLSEKLKLQNDSLSKQIQNNSQNISLISADLGTKIQTTDSNSKESISRLGNDVKKNRSYWIIGTLITIIIVTAIYWLLGKRIRANQTDVESQIRNTKKSLEEEGLKLDNKLIEFLEAQLKVQQEETKKQPITINEKADHSLALKVADEIVRMQKNISRMDVDIKGLKPLEKGIERIQANFASNGYEMVNLLNCEYDERMNIDVINFVEDNSLETGRKIISKIIKPQINYNGILIQRAQVEVSQN